MRKRIIDPNFFVDEKMSDLDYKTRLLYIGLWTVVDDFGLGKNNLKEIKGQIFPHTNSKIKKNFEKLVSIKRIEPYEVEGEKYFWIPKFLEYQWLSHPKQIFPATPVITGKIQKLLANRIEKKGIEKKRKESDYLNNFYPKTTM